MTCLRPRFTEPLLMSISTGMTSEGVISLSLLDALSYRQLGLPTKASLQQACGQVGWWARVQAYPWHRMEWKDPL